MSIAEKLTTIAENEQKVYEAGKKAEHDAFWDGYQNYGNRKDYAYAFYNGDYGEHRQWNNITFKPKYDLIPTVADRMFYNMEGVADLGEHLDKLGVKLDLSNCTRISLAFAKGDFIKLPTIDCAMASHTYGIQNMCSACSKLETIEKWIMSSRVASASSCFANCTKLKNLTVEGTIATSISFSASPLSISSIKSVIKHLRNFDNSTNNVVSFKNTGSFAELEKEGFTDEDYEWIEANLGYSKEDLINYGYDDWVTIVSLLGWEFTLSN